MKVWSSIFNLIAVLIIAIMLIVVNKISDTNARQFEEIRLSYAVDYAVEAAFRSAIATDTIGTDYVEGGLEEVKLNPTLILDTFDNILCLSYDLAPSEENFKKIEQSIATSVLCAIDGYYVLETTEVDSNPYDAVIGGEFELQWGVKRPYIAYSENGERLFAVNLVNEKSIEYIKAAEQLPATPDDSVGEPLIYRKTYASNTGDDVGKSPTGLTKESVKQAISKLITEDINFAIHSRNIANMNKQMKSFYMPASSSLTAINELKSPTLIVFFQDSSFLNGYNMDVTSVGGTRVKVKSNVIGFKQVGSDDYYYCYAGQQLGEPGVTVVKRFNSLHDAAMAGYKPHFVFLNKPLSK